MFMDGACLLFYLLCLNFNTMTRKRLIKGKARQPLQVHVDRPQKAYVSNLCMLKPKKTPTTNTQRGWAIKIKKGGTALSVTTLKWGTNPYKTSKHTIEYYTDHTYTQGYLSTTPPCNNSCDKITINHYNQVTPRKKMEFLNKIKHIVIITITSKASMQIGIQESIITSILNNACYQGMKITSIIVKLLAMKLYPLASNKK